MSAAGARPRSTYRAYIDWALVIAGVMALVGLDRGIGADGSARFDAIWALLHADFSRSPYALAGPVFALPLLMAGESLGHARAWVASYNLLVMLVGLGLLAWRLRPLLPPAVLRSFILLLMFGSMLPHHTQTFYGEVFTAFAVAAGIAGVVLKKPSSWIDVVLGIVNTPAAAVGGMLVVLRHMCSEKRLRYLLVPAAVAGLYLLDAWVRHGTWFVSGYEGDRGWGTDLPYSGLPGFSYPFFFGVLSLLFSFGKGIVFFAPGLLLCFHPLLQKLPPPLRRIQGLWLLFLAGLVVAYAQWWSWYGGWFWGPRFLLFAAFPASLALAFVLERSRSALADAAGIAVLALSCWVGLSGVLFGQANMGLCTANAYKLEACCWYVPEFSALWRPFVVHGAVDGRGQLLIVLWLAVFLSLAWAPAGRLAARALVRLRGWTLPGGPWKF